MKKIIIALAFLLAPVATHAAITDNLISYWNFNGNGTDSMGHFNLTTTGDSFISGIPDEAVTENDGYTLANSSAEYAMSGGSRTISVWVSVSSLPDTYYGSGSMVGIWGFHDLTSGAYGSGFQMSKNQMHFDTGTGTAWLEVGGDASTNNINYSFSNNTFYLITAVYSTTNITVYVNGSYAGTVPYTLGGVAQTGVARFFDTSAETYFSLGAGYTLTESTPTSFDGAGIWDRGLTSTEASFLYNAGAGQSYPLSTSTATTTPETFVTSTLGSPSLGIGKMCMWNGTDWTTFYFASSSVTPIYATSTVCQ